MVFDYKILPIRNETLDSPRKIAGFSNRKKTVTRKFRKDRRKSKFDRRRSVREGIFVSLSYRENRRKGGDRRQTPFEPPGSEPCFEA